MSETPRERPMIGAEHGAAADRVRLGGRCDASGAIAVPAFRLPYSSYASPESKAEMFSKFDRLEQLAAAAAETMPGDRRHPVLVQRELTDRFLFTPWLEQQLDRYDVTMTAGQIAGVEVQSFVPAAGISDSNHRRVLINLHGGGFMIGWNTLSQVESIPMAATGGIKVISINYRMFPEHRFPAATNDVVAVYRALLQSHAPSDVAIYGGSAGAILASQTMIALQDEGLPMPAALTLWSAPLVPEFSGDSAYITPHLGGFIPEPTDGSIELPYFGGADKNSPQVSPTRSRDMLAKFPPTLLATGTRAGDMSTMIRSHLDLLDVGVDARLYLWDALDHTFMYNPLMPESQQAYRLTTDFLLAAMYRAAAANDQGRSLRA